MTYVTSATDTVAVTYPRINWGAIIGGWLVATAVAGLLYVAGLALGFAAFDAHNAESTAKGIGIGTGIWFVLTWAAALLLGGMFASWVDNQVDHTLGALQGVAVWGLSLTATALWLALGFAHVAQGGAMAAAASSGRGGDTHTVTASNAAADEVAILHAQVERAFPGDRNNDTADAITAALLAGHDDAARRLLEARDTATPETEAALRRFGTAAASARNAVREQADKVAHYTSLTLWIAFLSGFLGLLAAAFGGWMGANHIHRVFHLRRYDSRPLPNAAAARPVA